MSEKLKVSYRRIEDLIPYARNARTHSDDQVARIAGSINEFGWTNPILVDGENGIIAGHGRLAAARKLGLSEVPVIELAGLSDVQKRAYILADNRLALDAGWDYGQLKIELEEIKACSEDLLNTVGFSEAELESLCNPSEHSYMDAVTEENFSSIDTLEKGKGMMLTLLFDACDRETVEAFVKAVGKENVSLFVLEKAKEYLSVD